MLQKVQSISFKLWLAIALTLSASFALGADEPRKTKFQGWEQMLIDGNIEIAQWFDGSAQSLDKFLSGRNYTVKKNETSVRIENSTFSNEGHRVTNSTALGVNLRLPNVEKYWQLKFTTYDETLEGRGVQNGYLRQTPRQQNYGATLGFIRKFGAVRTGFEPRIELQNPLKISHSLTFDSIADFGTFEFHPKIQFYATPTVGAGIFTSMNFNFKLNMLYSLAYINEGDYQEKQHLFNVVNGFILAQAYDRKTSFAYSILANSNNRESYNLDGYSFAFSWNRLLYKRILDMQLTPHLDFVRDVRFKGVAGLTLHLYLNF